MSLTPHDLVRKSRAAFIVQGIIPVVLVEGIAAILLGTRIGRLNR